MYSLDRDYLRAAALQVEQQALAYPGIGIPVDPDVADFMGAFAGQEELGEILAANLGGQEDDH